MRRSLGLIVTTALALAPIGGGALRAGALPTSPPPNGGTVSIEPSTADESYDPSLHVFVDAAAKALTDRGFTVFDDPGHAASVVNLVLSRTAVGTGLARVPGQRAASVAGTGVAIPLATGDSQQVVLRRTRLEMRIHRRGETAIVWDGTAVTVREGGTAKGTDDAVASDLVRALLQSYPAIPKDVVGVP